MTRMGIEAAAGGLWGEVDDEIRKLNYALRLADEGGWATGCTF